LTWPGESSIIQGEYQKYEIIFPEGSVLVRFFLSFVANETATGAGAVSAWRLLGVEHW
jgi:hypothetical protein